MTRTRRTIAIAVAALAVTLIVVGVTAQAPELHLVNADFEGGFTVREASEVEVAVGWDYAYLNSDRQCPAPCSRPEFKPEKTIVVSGTSQRWFSTYARQFAAISQRVAVQPGQWYEFSCQVYAISEPMGQMGAFVGINPWGGSPFERTMIWGKEQVGDSGWIYRQWTRVAVTAQAWSGTITVAAAGNNAWPTRNNAVYWDNCSIRRVDIGALPTATPAPTWTPAATYTPFPTWTPGPVVTPCPTCEPGTGGCDYDRIRSDMEDVVANREPVRWPR